MPVCSVRLLKVLYGLKQGGRKWYEALWQELERMGFKRCDADHMVFYLHEVGTITVLTIHVDDCTITENSQERIDRVKRDLNVKFKLTNLGLIGWMLGIAVTWNLHVHTISLSQRSYIELILTCGNFTDLTPRATLMDPNVILSSAQCPTTINEITYMQKIPY
jgi:hypothetical protein